MSSSLYVYECTVQGDTVEKVDTCEVGNLEIWGDLNAFAEDESTGLTILQKSTCLYANNKPMSCPFPKHIEKIHEDVLEHIACNVDVKEWQHYETSLFCANNQTVLFPPNLPGYTARCVFIPIHQPNGVQVYPAVHGRLYHADLYCCLLMPVMKDTCYTFPSSTEGAIYMQISWLERLFPRNAVDSDMYHWMCKKSWMFPMVGWNVRILDLSNTLYFQLPALRKHIVLFMKDFIDRRHKEPFAAISTNWSRHYCTAL